MQHLQEKLKERERELRKRKERDEQEMERVRLKVRRKEAVASYQALLVEKIKSSEVNFGLVDCCLVLSFMFLVLPFQKSKTNHQIENIGVT